MVWLAAQISDPMVKTTKVIENVNRCPKEVTIQVFRSWLATIVARNAVDAHCARSWPTPKAPMMDGTATLTMVADRIITMAPNRPPMVTSQR